MRPDPEDGLSTYTDVVSRRDGRASTVQRAPREIWLDVANRDPEALPTQHPAWMDAVCANGWRSETRLYVREDGRRIILPIARAPWRMPFECSPRTHWGFGGLLGDGGVRAEDVALVHDDLAHRRLLRISIRPNPLHGELWRIAGPEATVVPRCAHVIDLSGGADAVWERIPRKGRKAIRASAHRGVTVECDSTGALLPTFFDLLHESRQHWARAQREPLWFAHVRYRMYDTFEKWSCIQGHMNEACRVYLARQDGVPVAASIVLFGTNVHHTRSASARELCAQTYANEAIVWAAVQDACREGARSYHMGETGDSASLAQFKEKLGCRPYSYPEMRYERLPFTAADQALRRTVKRMIGFTDIR